MRLAAAVERRVAEQAAREQRGGTGDGAHFGNLIDVGDSGSGREEDGFASWGDDSSGYTQTSQQVHHPLPSTDLTNFLTTFGAEDCESRFIARGYRTVADVAAAQLTEGELQELGVRGYGVKGMISALRKQQPTAAASLHPAPAPAPTPEPGALLDMLEWS